MSGFTKRRVQRCPRRRISGAEDNESNNKDLALALARCRAALSDMEQQKFQYVTENLRCLETISRLKHQVKYLQQEKKDLKFELANLQSRQNIFPTPESSFDSGLSVSSEGKEENAFGIFHDTDKTVKTKSSTPVKHDTQNRVNIRRKLDVSMPHVDSDQEVSVPVFSRRKESVDMDSAIAVDNTSITQTPRCSRRTVASKSYVLPSINKKLRRGDEYTDNFSMAYIKTPKTNRK